jgi:hypothetical protein
VISVSDLDARIRAEIKGMADSSHDAASGYFADALCAVLNLHRHQHADQPHGGNCYHCGDPYPCPTVVRIAAALGVADE